ncbi:MAG: DUF2807 domain-containing protein [Chloroflexi bacterium]|nr:DUF2807 domain-containing protein [Chloroflexota bacterium]
MRNTMSHGGPAFSRRRLLFQLLLAALAATLLAGCNYTGLGGPVTGSGKLVTRDYGFSNFDDVEASHAFQLEVLRSDSYSVAVTIDDNLADALDVTQSGSRIHIDLKPGNYIRTTQRAKVTLPTLRRLDLSGAANASLSGFQSSDLLEIGLSGASKITGGAAAGPLSANLSGASSLNLRGSAASLSLEGSGASSADLGSCPVESASVRLSGASRATVNVNGKLDADLSGASKLTYTGNASLGAINTSGGSNVNRK